MLHEKKNLRLAFFRRILAVLSPTEQEELLHIIAKLQSATVASH
jgi:hypothetical protein